MKTLLTILLLITSLSVCFGQRGMIPTKSYFDTNGYLHNYAPHAWSTFADSSVTIDLTEDVWKQITNIGKSLWPVTDYRGFTESNDTIIIGNDGHYKMEIYINLTGSDVVIWNYRIRKRTGATITTLMKFKTKGTGTEVLRTYFAYLEVNAGDRIWLEIMNETGNQDPTIYGGGILISPIHLTI